MSTFADRLKQSRLEKGLTQDELAALAKVSQSLIVKIETGETLQSRKASQLAHALGVDTDWLARGVGSKDGKDTLNEKEKRVVEVLRMAQEIIDSTNDGKLKANANRLLRYGVELALEENVSESEFKQYLEKFI